jgi:hypothetical protein
MSPGNQGVFYLLEEVAFLKSFGILKFMKMGPLFEEFRHLMLEGSGLFKSNQTPYWLPKDDVDGNIGGHDKTPPEQKVLIPWIPGTLFSR